MLFTASATARCTTSNPLAGNACLHLFVLSSRAVFDDSSVTSSVGLKNSKAWPPSIRMHLTLCALLVWIIGASRCNNKQTHRGPAQKRILGNRRLEDAILRKRSSTSSKLVL